MKKLVLLVSLVAVLALCASAQTLINFSQMPLASTPSPMPDRYPAQSNMYWDNFYYVTPGLWHQSGPGFHVDPATQHNTVGFIGGPLLCTAANVCTGSIKMQAAAARPASFTPISILATAGWAPNTVLVTAYNNSRFVGRVTWNLTLTPRTFVFPATWRGVTQLVFALDVPRVTARPQAGSMVIYSFVLVEH